VPVAALAGRGRWPLLALPVVLALHPRVVNRAATLGLRLLRRPRPPRSLGARPIATAFAASLAAWLLQGTHLWLLCGGNPVTCAGAMALAMTAGTFAFLLPSGAGVREAVLVAVLTTAGRPAGQALAFALASRVMFTLADLVTASLATGTPRRRRSGTPLEGTASRPG
jgi:glycosyltransferase 2 family protein